MNSLTQLIQDLRKEGYKQISLPEFAFQYRRQYNADIDVQQLRKALVRSGIWASYMKDDVLTLSALPVVSHFNKLPQNKVSKALRGNA